MPTPDLATFLEQATLGALRGGLRGEATPASSRRDLGAFWQAKKQRDGDVVRVKFTDLDGRVRLTTLKLDLR